MDDDKDSRLAGPYQQTPREEPPARVDRTAMELSRTSVRRRSLVPSGNRWMVAAALAGTSIISVLLVVLLPEQARVPDLPRSLQDAGMPARDRLQQQERLLQFAADTVAGGTGDPAAGKPEPARERFDFYTVMPEARQGLPPEERSDTPAVLPSQDGAGDIVAYYLQIEGFSSLEVTRAMQDKLAFMRLDSRIQSGEGRDGYHIQLGPYTDLNELEQVQSRLGKRGIKSTRERLP